MDPKFEAKVKELPDFFTKLQKSSKFPRSQLEGIPKKGIYVFYEGDKPIYVGRSNRMKMRLQEHSRPSSGHFSATFAFNLAVKRAKENGIDIDKERGQLLVDPHFNTLFLEEKERVSRMLIQTIEIDDQISQTLFEVYASMALDTLEFNDFTAH